MHDTLPWMLLVINRWILGSQFIVNSNQESVVDWLLDGRMDGLTDKQDHRER